MAPTVTLTLDPLTASVRLSVAGGVAPYVADASPGGDRPDYRVRTTWSSVVGDPTARIGIDGAIPLNTPTQYVVTDATGAQVTSSVIEAPSDVPILSDATDPGRALVVLVAAQKPNRWEGRSVWWDILGSSAPFASIMPMRYRSGPLVLRLETTTQRADLTDLMRPGNPLLFRGVCSDAVDDVIMLIESVDEDLVMAERPAGPFLWTLNYQAISRDLGPYALDASRSYATVVSTFATYADVLATYGSYDALRVGDPTEGLGPDLVVNGGFSAGMSSWSTFWGQVTWDTAAGTGRGTATAAGQTATLENVATSPGGAGLTVAPGDRYRLTGRVRSSAGGVSVYVHFITNTAPDLPAYFQPGAVFALLPITAGATWSTFTLEGVVPPGDDRLIVVWRADALPAGAVIEWDDLTLKAITG